MVTLEQVKKRYGSSCFYCNEPADTKDHFVPISKGGKDTIENLRPCCSVDNLIKGDMLPEQWEQYMRTGEYRRKKRRVRRNRGKRVLVKFDDVFDGMPRTRSSKPWTKYSWPNNWPFEKE